MTTAILGRRKRGKSSLATYFARQKPKRFYWDPKAYWRPIPGDLDARHRIVHGRHANVHPTTETLAEQWRHAPEIVVQPDDERAEWPVWMAALRAHVEAHPGDRFAIVIDEYGLVDERWEMDDFNWLLRSVENDRVDVYLVAHRIIDIGPRFRTLVDYWAVFNVVLPDDARAIARFVPVDPDELMTMQGHTFYWWNDGDGRGTLCTNAAAWFVPFVPKLTHAAVVR